MDLGFLIFIIVSGFAYLIPAIIAAKRNHQNQNSIFVLNLLTGWTFIGWVGSLIWAFSSNSPVVVVNSPAPVPPQSMPSDDKDCPFCAETIKAKAIVCKHCGKDLNNDYPAKR